jgi:simple sugar transport system substrate-binding protein
VVFLEQVAQSVVQIHEEARGARTWEEDMKKLTGLVSALALTVGFASASAAETTMGIVVKIGGIPWFNAMEDGIKRRAEELGVTAEMI